MITNAQLIQGYADMVEDREAAGFKAYLLSFMFTEIGGSPSRVQEMMRHEVERVYATLLTRIVRHPRSAWHKWKVPLLIGCPDWPVPKHDRWDKQMIRPNDGQHVHAVVLIPPVSRLKEPLDHHIHEEQGSYVRSPLFRIHVEPITHDARYVIEYVLKALERGRVTPDDLIILPRALSELETKRSRVPFNSRERSDGTTLSRC